MSLEQDSLDGILINRSTPNSGKELSISLSSQLMESEYHKLSNFSVVHYLIIHRSSLSTRGYFRHPWFSRMLTEPTAHLRWLAQTLLTYRFRSTWRACPSFTTHIRLFIHYLCVVTFVLNILDITDITAQYIFFRGPRDDMLRKRVIQFCACINLYL